MGFWYVAVRLAKGGYFISCRLHLALKAVPGTVHSQASILRDSRSGCQYRAVTEAGPCTAN